jgi:hypothetical protein
LIPVFDQLLDVGHRGEAPRVGRHDLIAGSRGANPSFRIAQIYAKEIAMKVYERLADAFIAEGTSHVFGMMGDGNM